MSRQVISVAFILQGILSVSMVSGQELLVRYTFDEETGVAIDSGTGDRSNGVLGPQATRTPNTPGMISPFALDLSADGTDSFVNGGDAAEVDTLESFTLTTWLFLEAANSESGGSGNVRLLAKQGPDPFDGFSWNLNNPNSGARGVDDFRTGCSLVAKQDSLSLLPLKTPTPMSGLFSLLHTMAL